MGEGERSSDEDAFPVVGNASPTGDGLLGRAGEDDPSLGLEVEEEASQGDGHRNVSLASS